MHRDVLPVSVVCCALITLTLGAPRAGAGPLYSEDFDTANAKILTNSFGPGISSAVVNLPGIPESPRHLSGLAQSYLRLAANRSFTSSAVAAVNCTAADETGTAPLMLTGNYRVSFDVYLDVNLPALPYSGSTETMLWGIGTSNLLANGRTAPTGNNDGTWGWLAADGGFAVEDSTLYINNTVVEQLAQQPPNEFPGFSQAFGNVSPNNVPWDKWTRVDVDVVDSVVSTYFNDVLFHRHASTQTTGYAFLGYQDPFAGLNPYPTLQYGLYDNFRIVVIPEPAVIMLGVWATLLMRRDRKSAGV